MEEKNSEKKERKMRDSGIPWIGEVPEKWKVMKIGHCFRLKNEKNFLPENKVQLLSLYTGIGVFPTNSEKAKTSGNHAQTVNGYKIVHKNDIVVNIILAWMGSIGVSDYDGVVSPAYDVYTPDLSKAIPRYAHYVFRTDGIAGECLKYGRGIMMMRWRTYSPEFKQIKIPFPSLKEQHRIADFLDSKCSEIDALIENLRARMESVKEYKKAVITEAVTKGLDKDAKMKDSGVEWIGEVPEEWDVKRNSLNFDIRKTLVGENWSNMQLLSLTTNGVKNITIDDQVGKRPKTLATYQIAHKNDIVMCLFDLDASAVFSGLCKKNGIISPAYKLLKCKNGMFPPYAEYYFRAVFDGRKYKKYAKSIRYTISTNDFMHLKMPVPPLAEQQQIADYLDEKCKNINNRVQKRRQQLEWLKEYKKSLIFDYVTGKKRVEK